MKSAGKLPFEACILAGGLSSRMGKDKARLRLGKKSLLAHVREAAAGAGLPVRVIRKDLVPRCGPMGGVFTALQSTKAEAVVVLSCDMPFVTSELLVRLLARLRGGIQAVFVENEDQEKGFPFVICATALSQVEDLLTGQQRSLQALATRLRASSLRVPVKEARKIFNVNTPEEYRVACQRWSCSRRTPPAP